MKNGVMGEGRGVGLADPQAGSRSCVCTRVLTRVQLTSGREPSSNPPMDVG